MTEEVKADEAFRVIVPSCCSLQSRSCVQAVRYTHRRGQTCLYNSPLLPTPAGVTSPSDEGSHAGNVQSGDYSFDVGYITTYGADNVRGGFCVFFLYT